MNLWAVVTASFLASSVEMVEALTIVLAVAYTSGWRPALQGAIAALVALAAMVAIGIPSYTSSPRLGSKSSSEHFLFGSAWGWLQKAVLRASGRKAHRNEDAVYTREVARLHEDRRAGWRPRSTESSSRASRWC